MENLEPDDELDTATSVKSAGAPAEEHGQVAILARGLPLQLDDITDVLELRFRRTVTLAAETTQYESGFLLAPDFDKPARRFGHGPHDEEEEDEGHDLESDWEAPDEGRIDLTVKGGAVFDPVSDDDAENVQGEFDGDELAAGCVAGGFGRPDGSDGVQNARPDPVEDTGAKHPLGVLGGALEGGADDSPQGSHGDRLNPTISITEPASQEGAEKGARKVVHCDLESHLSEQWHQATMEVVLSGYSQFLLEEAAY